MELSSRSLRNKKETRWRSIESNEMHLSNHEINCKSPNCRRSSPKPYFPDSVP